MTEPHVLFARQPIFNQNLKTIAYELLFRDENNENSFIDGDKATSQLLLSVYTEATIEKAVGPKKAFVNFTRNLLLNPPPIDKKHIVIEILEDLKIDDALIESVKTLKRKGYTIAMDDYVYSKDTAPLLKLVDIIKLDVLALSEDQLIKHAKYLKSLNLKLLAEKVEDHKMYRHCVDLGFDYFQGYFLCKPTSVRGTSIPASKVVVLQLMAALQNPDLPFSELERLIVNDPVMSLKLLQMINSAAFYLSKEVESIQRAITILGAKQLKSWVSLLSLSNLSQKPAELSALAIQRAKMCEVIADSCNPRESQQFFTVGLFSLLDAFFDLELSEIIEPLPLTTEVKEAILQREGVMGFVLDTAIAHEQNRWENINWLKLSELKISGTVLNEAYQEGVRWADEVTSILY